MIVKPAKSGSTFLNYKQTFSVVLMALVDANYAFRYVHVGAQGRISDAGVFSQCRLAEALERNELGLPAPSCIPGSNIVTPYMVVADDAFPLRHNIMKPFPRRNLSKMERIFNYRLSRTRRVVENAFGIMSAKFRVYKSPLAVHTSTVRKIVLATTTLHNFILQNHTDASGSEYTFDVENTEQGLVTEGDWRLAEKESHGLKPLRACATSGRIPANAKQMRQQLAEYFVNEGEVEWQWRCAGVEK